MFAKVDNDQFEELSKYKWQFGNTCARRVTPRAEGHKTVLMHRQIMGFPRLEVDHINGDQLDNRKENLRLVTSLQNKWNRHDNPTGVYFHKRDSLWVMQIRVNYKRLRKYFKNKEDAIFAYKEAVKSRWTQEGAL